MTHLARPQSQNRRIIQEDIEWCDVWLPHLNEDALPRVLLIGDSITRAYYGQVEATLEGEAYVGRLATSRSVSDPGLIKELEGVLSQNQFDVIHFNNGMHGWGYTEEEYQQYFPEFVNAIRQYQFEARLIWASITPVRIAGNLNEFDARTERIRVRNAISLQFVEREKIPLNDLFSLAIERADYYSNDGVHFNEKGSAALAQQVAGNIRAALQLTP